MVDNNDDIMVLFEIMKPTQLKRYSDAFLAELDEWLDNHVKPVNAKKAYIYKQALEHEIDVRVELMEELVEEPLISMKSLMEFFKFEGED